MAPMLEDLVMKHNNRIALLLIGMGLVVGLVRGTTAQSQSLDRLIFALHVTIPPSWFDPAETPAQITPFGILYALHDAVVRPLPGERMAPALATSWTESPDGCSRCYLKPLVKISLYYQ